MSGAFTAAAAETVGTWAAANAGTIAAGAATSVGGAVASKLLAPSSHINIPPPPGAAMIDPAGARAAAMTRARQASAGGLNSTITGAGTNPGASTSLSAATAGAKNALGQ